MIDLNTLNHYRVRMRNFDGSSLGDDTCGAFLVPVRNKHIRDYKRDLSVVASSGYGWEHVSVSHPKKTPTWDEMEFIKRMFFKPEETVMQLHVSVKNHINIHPYCLHLWRPTEVELPLPPEWMV